ncbi:MAG: hypothetical protein GY951_13095 [Psychromonas sp.]|nr:hypothetical protein [Alteromonadales bacterium]MCP5078977.1 hypothetical protein [Psychromonas sp.]
MNNKQIQEGLLINEWQLGSQLNIAVTNGTRDKFNLLLSLLSDDARDFPQFDLPKATQASLTTLELRESLSLPEPQPLVNKGLSLQQAEKLSVAVHKQQFSDIRLQSILNNEALLTRQTETNFDAEVVDNLPFLSQARLKHNNDIESDCEENAKGVDFELVEKYQALQLDDKPLKVTYM